MNLALTLLPLKRATLIIFTLFSLIMINVALADSSKESDGLTSNDQTKAKERNPKNDLICKKEKVLGSNMRRRVCYRRSDVEARRQTDNQDLKRRQTQTARPTFQD